MQWNAATGETAIFEGKGHTNQINQMLVDTSHGQPVLVTCAMDDSIRVTPLATRKYEYYLALTVYL